MAMASSLNFCHGQPHLGRLEEVIKRRGQCGIVPMITTNPRYALHMTMLIVASPSMYNMFQWSPTLSFELSTRSSCDLRRWHRNSLAWKRCDVPTSIASQQYFRSFGSQRGWGWCTRSWRIGDVAIGLTPLEFQLWYCLGQWYRLFHVGNSLTWQRGDVPASTSQQFFRSCKRQLRWTRWTRSWHVVFGLTPYRLPVFLILPRPMLEALPRRKRPTLRCPLIYYKPVILSLLLVSWMDQKLACCLRFNPYRVPVFLILPRSMLQALPCRKRRHLATRRRPRIYGKSAILPLIRTSISVSLMDQKPRLPGRKNSLVIHGLVQAL